ncbi:SatD family protein [Kribbia dieselivorans]|uniref:SatD family protein n=1 Tax=Kribbia dieselivorans TaxID=331526 RepID=UPI0008383E09|nr:SatD family protein [Kribbia dieselivorans]
MSPSTGGPVATLIGDVVRSREHDDREALHDRLVAAIEHVNAEVRPTRPLHIVLGDEYQGTFATVGQALHAAMTLRLHLAPGIDVRHGVGWGPVTQLDDATSDGPGWWAARRAITEVHDDEEKAALRLTRTAYAAAEGDDGAGGPTVEAVNAALRCQDHLLGSCDERSVRILRRLMTGEAQVRIAAAEGISPSAVSQRIRSDGLAVIALSHDLLRSAS